LDEPTAGLDPNQRRDTLALIQQLGRERTVLLSTHLLPEVETLCQRVVVLKQGRAVAVGSPAELGQQLAPAARPIELDCRGDGPQLAEALRQVAGVAAVDPLSPSGDLHTFRVRIDPASDSAMVCEQLAKAVLTVGALRALRPVRSSLARVFAALTAGGGEAAAD
jgi:ABC-2 type transport system ATP-binding protein